MPAALAHLMKSGDDQEVTRIVHAGNDIDLEGEPGAIIFLRHAPRQAVHLEPVGEPLLGLAAQLLVLVVLCARRVGIRADREARQDRLAGGRPIRTALGNLDGRCQGLRHVGKQDSHFGTALEAMIRGELVAIGFRDQASAGDAQQRVMGFIIVGGGKIGSLVATSGKPLV